MSVLSNEMQADLRVKSLSSSLAVLQTSSSRHELNAKSHFYDGQNNYRHVIAFTEKPASVQARHKNDGTQFLKTEHKLVKDLI